MIELPVYRLVDDWPAWLLLAAIFAAAIGAWGHAIDQMRQGKWPQDDGG